MFLKKYSIFGLLLLLLGGCKEETIIYNGPEPLKWKILVDHHDPGALLSIWSNGPDNIWVAGGKADQAVALSFDGDDWTSHDTGLDTQLWWVHGFEDSTAIVVGNGGSAAMASHVAVDFTKAASMRAITFNEADLLTCFANDYGYEQWVVEALNFYADPGDVVILISSSGTSKNIVNGASRAKELDLKTITLSGFSKENDLVTKGDVNFWIGSNSYNIVEMTHHVWLVAIIDYLIEISKNQ